MALAALRLPLTFDGDRLARDADALSGNLPRRQPGPYHGGEWTGLSLIALGGRGDDAGAGRPGLDEYRATPLLAATPYFREVLDTLACPKQSARLLYLPPDGHIREHVDPPANPQHGLLRFHIPVVTHPDVEFVVAGERQRWRPGELWWADFSRPHSVRNKSDILRIHLVVDVEVNDFVLGLFPDDVVAEWRAGGIAVHRPAVRLGLAKLARFLCTFRVPADAFPGVPAGTSGEIQLASADELRLIIGGQVYCRLAPVSERELVLVGGSAGITITDEAAGEDEPFRPVLVIRGLPPGVADGPEARVALRRLPLVP